LESNAVNRVKRKLVFSDFATEAKDACIAEIIKAINENSISATNKVVIRCVASNTVDRAVLRGCAWAVWSKYGYSLARIVDCEAPETGAINGSVSNNLVLSFTDEKLLSQSQRTLTEMNDAKSPEYALNLAGFSKTAIYSNVSRILQSGPEMAVRQVAPLLRTNTELSTNLFLAGDLIGTNKSVLVPQSWNLSDSGLYTFINRVLAAERRVYAFNVQPKEYAQNISDVSARQSFIDLVGALQAVLPVHGVSAQAQMQYMHQSQELMQAIMRRPLLVGFGMGQSQFGWVLGPKFTIENQEAKFLHVPIRHDCSAGIVVPAWLSVVNISGEYA
jgi:hypothetical protein